MNYLQEQIDYFDVYIQIKSNQNDGTDIVTYGYINTSYLYSPKSLNALN